MTGMERKNQSRSTGIPYFPGHVISTNRELAIYLGPSTRRADRPLFSAPG